MANSTADNASADLQKEGLEQPINDANVYVPPKGRKILGLHMPLYRAPMTQIWIVAFILFLNPGMYNALAGLGGAGQVDATAQNNAGIALHSCFAVFGFVAGVANNYLGVRWTMAIGGTGYALYSASFLCYNHTKNSGFVIFAGAYLGFCAAFLWCAQGVVMMSYPTEGQRGRAIAITWFIFNLGSVIGAAVTLGQNWAVKAGSVTDGTYVAFIVLEALGAVLCFFLCKSESIIRSDGTRVQKVVHPSLKSDVIGLWTTLRNDWWVVLLFPMFFASNYFYTYQFNDMNSYYFSTRTRAFNNIFYWVAQMIGAALMGMLLDYSRFSRRRRALVGWGILFVLVNAIWGGGLKFLEQTARGKTSPLMDIFDNNYFWYLFLYMWYGFLDAIWQSYAYYTMGAMTNSPKKLAYYAGFYKSVQAVGAAVVSALDADKYPYATLFGSSWGLMAGALVVSLPVYIWRIKDTEMTAEDLEDTVMADGQIKDDVAAELAHEKVPTKLAASGTSHPATLPATGPMGVMGAASEAAEMGDVLAESK